MTNFERWTENPQALIQATREIDRVKSLLDLIDIDAWAASENPTPVFKHARRAICTDVVSGEAQHCLVLGKEKKIFNDTYTVIWRDDAHTYTWVPANLITYPEE